MHLGLYIIDEHGDVVPCEDTLVWGKWFERASPIWVARTILENGIKVSTVFLAIDYGFNFLNLSALPLLFETAIFLGHVKLDQYRYPDWSTAAADHLRLVDEWARRLPND